MKREKLCGESNSRTFKERKTEGFFFHCLVNKEESKDRKTCYKDSGDKTSKYNAAPVFIINLVWLINFVPRKMEFPKG